MTENRLGGSRIREKRLSGGGGVGYFLKLEKGGATNEEEVKCKLGIL